MTRLHTKRFRLIVRVSNCGPEGQPFAPDFRTVVIESEALAQALVCGTYSHAAVIGAEPLSDEKQLTNCDLCDERPAVRKILVNGTDTLICEQCSEERAK